MGKHASKKKPRKSLTYKALKFVLAVWTRLELATPCVTGRYSNQLNYQTSSSRPKPFRFPTAFGRGAKIARSKLFLKEITISIKKVSPVW